MIFHPATMFQSNGDEISRVALFENSHGAQSFSIRFMESLKLCARFSDHGVVAVGFVRASAIAVRMEDRS
jgi:hypothetical protein